jgi:transposase
MMEAAGVYSLDWATTLYRAGWPVAVIHPRSFHHFAQLKLNHSKTDPTDASLLADTGSAGSPNCGRRQTIPGWVCTTSVGRSVG